MPGGYLTPYGKKPRIPQGVPGTSSPSQLHRIHSRGANRQQGRLRILRPPAHSVGAALTKKSSRCLEARARTSAAISRSAYNPSSLHRLISSPPFSSFISPSSSSTGTFNSLCLVELRSRFFACDHVAGLLAHRPGTFPPAASILAFASSRVRFGSVPVNTSVSPASCVVRCFFSAVISTPASLQALYQLAIGRPRKEFQIALEIRGPTSSTRSSSSALAVMMRPSIRILLPVIALSARPQIECPDPSAPAPTQPL